MNLNTSQPVQRYSTLGEMIDLLGSLLGNAISEVYGPAMFNKVETLRLNCKEVDGEKKLAEIKNGLANYSLTDLRKLAHCFSVFFLVCNQAEQCEIIKINRGRKSRETVKEPRLESIAWAIHSLKEKGFDISALQTILNDIQVTPTITAHPTEARRRSVLQKQLGISESIFSLSTPHLGERAAERELERLRANILGLLVTDDVRAKRLSVQDEVANGIFFLAGPILEIVPAIMDDVARASENYLGKKLRCPPLLRYRSWIGGDRDGNPNVTAQLTTEALALHKEAIIGHYLVTLRTLRDELSVSSRKCALPDRLLASVVSDKQRLGLPAEELIDAHQMYEPFREKCETISLKLRRALENSYPYSETEFLADLEIQAESLSAVGLGALGEHGTLTKLRNQAEVFGFSLADLDLRQHSKVHESAINEILNAHGLCDQYSALEENAKVSILKKIIDDLPQQSNPAGLSAETVEALAVFKLIGTITDSKQPGLGAYVISMTHSVSDMLEPLALWKLAGGKGSFPLNLAPLFETIDDLQGSEKLLSAIVSNTQF